MLGTLVAASLIVNGTSSQSQPNYTPQSVHVASSNNPVYSFPSSVDSTTAVNGRLYKGAPIIGGVDVGATSDLAQAAASYGALGDESARIRVDVEGLFRFNPTTTVEINPWAPVCNQQTSPASDPYSRAHSKLAVHAEQARLQWLADNNYTGGVRTFVNDAELYAVPAAKKTELPQPHGIIELNPEVPAFRSRMHVMGTVHLPPGTQTASSDVIKVVPAAVPKTATAKVEAPKADVPKAEDKPAETVAAK